MISYDICLSLSGLTLLSMTISRSIHIAASGIISFFFYGWVPFFLFCFENISKYFTIEKSFENWLFDHSVCFHVTTEQFSKCLEGLNYQVLSLALDILRVQIYSFLSKWSYMCVSRYKWKGGWSWSGGKGNFRGSAKSSEKPASSFSPLHPSNCPRDSLCFFHNNLYVAQPLHLSFFFCI